LKAGLGTESRRAPLADAGMPANPDELRALAGFAAALLRNAVRTDAALPDRERRWLSGPRCSLPDVMPDPGAYDSEGARDDAKRAARFRPSKQDVERCPVVMGWLAWLKRQNDGRRDVKIIIRRAFGTPLWKIAADFGRSDDTIRRWEGAAIAAIVNRYWREIRALETPGGVGGSRR
jgi:hypothetical protein